MIYIFIVLVMLFIVWNIGSFCVMMDYGPELIIVDNLHDILVNMCILYWIFVFGSIAILMLFVISSAITCSFLEDTKYSDCKICSFFKIGGE